jgi:hypothetical protein
MIIRIVGAFIAAAMIAAAAAAMIAALIGSIGVPAAGDWFESLLQYLAWRSC